MIKREVIKKDNKVKLTFVQPQDAQQPGVAVVGDFNNWDPTAHRLQKRSNGTASVSVTVDAGAVYRFRYYTDDGRWYNDDAADAYVPSGHGSEDCIVKC